MDVLDYNRRAWDHQVRHGNRWTVPVSGEEISRARAGQWRVVLTPTWPVPMEWFPQVEGRFAGTRILALASGGGQQAPIFAAAGADVTVFDLSPQQLEQDRLVAAREGLALKTVEGDMRDLSVFDDGAFDLIFHPCANSFVPELQPVWDEAFRVLRRGGALLSGIVNPVVYAVDPELDRKGIAQLKYRIPYSDLTSLSDTERAKYTSINEPLCFGHTLEDQLGGQMKAGFHLAGLYEDRWHAGSEEDAGALNALIPCFLATRALKP
jgi:SAM-dependent methyltransferase